MNWELLIQHSLIAGAIYSLALGTLVLISLKINPEMWWQDYAPEVRAAFGPMSEKAKKQRTIFAAIFFPALIAGLAFATMRLATLPIGGSWFVATLISTAIIIGVFNTVDAVIIDWLILMVLFPKLAVLPGTEGMAFYRDIGLQVKNFFKGFIFVGVGSLITAGIALIFQ